MQLLGEVLDAKLLLFLNQLPVDAKVAELLEAACAQFPVKNLKFLNDVYKAWQRHAGRPTGVPDPGSLRWRWAQERLATYPKKTLPHVDGARIENLIGIVRNYSTRCTFNRSGDTVVKEVLKVQFPPALLAGMGTTEAPYAKAATVFEHELNDTVQALIKTNPNDRLMATDWRHSTDPADLVFFCYLAWEMLGQQHMPTVLKNHEICYELNADVPWPQMVVYEDRIGFLWSGTLFFTGEGVAFPVLVLFVHWVRCNALCGDTCCRSLQCAIETPALLSARDPLYCLL